MRPWVWQREASESRLSDKEERTQDQADSQPRDVAHKAPGTVGAGGGIGEVVTINWLGVDCKHGVPELKSSE